jgi:D-beta-D-heptose 7-phosphate kinase/D-beta-D-heptose 1-phosphate adenosyltransferase
MEHERLRLLLEGFTGKRVLVVGDCMLDEYLWGRVNRISPEAPVMVVEQVDTTYAAGGASNVAANIVAMDGQAAIVAVVGDDPMASRLRHELTEQGVGHEGLVTVAERPTTVKTRIVAHNQQVVRVDREDRSPVSPQIAAALVERARSGVAWADAVLFSDYSKGVLTEPVVTEITRLARAAGKPVFANPKPSSLASYRDLALVTVNQSEAEAVTGLRLGNDSLLEEAGRRLIELCRSEAVIVTLGGRGLALFQAEKPWRQLPVVPLEVYDPCGCGDSAIAAATLTRAAGADWVEAATVANLAGNAKVRKLGVVPVTRKEIEGVWAMSHARSNGGAPSSALGLDDGPHMTSRKLWESAG